jgi:hypothetical protein
MNLNLEVNEINFILQVLGELPSKTGAFVLIQKIEAQAKEQGKAQEPVKTEE